MTRQQITQQIRAQIAEGHIEKAARQLVRYLDEEWINRENKEQIHLYNQALQQLSQMNELRQEEVAGVISRADADLKRNKVREALLALTYQLQDSGQGKQIEKTGEIPLAQKASTGKLWKAVISTMALVIIALAVWMISSTFFSRSQQGNEQKEPIHIVFSEENQDGNTDVRNVCYVETSILTLLYKEPKLFGKTKIGELPDNTELKVLEIKSYIHMNAPVYFFKVEDPYRKVTGWVQQEHLRTIGPKCFEQWE